VNALLAAGLLVSLGAGGILLLRSLKLGLSRLELVAYGPPAGLVVGSLLILLLASFVGRLTPVIVAAPVLALPGAAFVLRRSREGTVAAPEVPTPGRPLLLVLGIAALAWALFWSQALRVTPDGISAGTVTIWGDWSLHLGDVSSFAYGDNFPPQNPRFAGRGYPYHYLTSITAAAMVRLGMDPLQALPLHSFLLCVLVAAGLTAFTLRLTGDSTVAVLTLVLFLFGSGLAWWWGLDEAVRTSDLTMALARVREVSAQGAQGYEWQNVHLALLVPQRGYLYGLPLGLLILTLVYDAVESGDVRTFAIAGLFAGLLPLAHLSTLLALALMTPFLVLLHPRRGWVAFFGLWVALAVPQLYWQQGGSAGPASALRLQPGWMAGSVPWVWFWLKNLGCFVPLLVVALLDRSLLPRRGARFLLAFMAVFVLANLLVFQPWDWDNTKILVYWYLAGCILVAALLRRTWCEKGSGIRAFVALALVTLLLSGTLLHLYQALGMDRHLLLTREEVQLAEQVRASTPPRALFAAGPRHNHPVSLLGGRRLLMGFPGYLWSTGIDFTARQRDLEAIFTLSPAAADLLRAYGVDYVVIGPFEREQLRADVPGYRARYPRVVHTADYEVFAVGPGDGAASDGAGP
jgi:hypothetical protein